MLPARTTPPAPAKVTKTELMPREEHPTAELLVAPKRTVTVWIGNDCYQAVLVV